MEGGQKNCEGGTTTDHFFYNLVSKTLLDGNIVFIFFTFFLYCMPFSESYGPKANQCNIKSLEVL